MTNYENLLNKSKESLDKILWNLKPKLSANQVDAIKFLVRQIENASYQLGVIETEEQAEWDANRELRQAALDHRGLP